MKKLYFAFMAFFAVILSYSQAGNYVPGYTYPAEPVEDVAIDATGNIIIIGTLPNGTGFAKRLSSNGTPDPTFNLSFPYSIKLALVQSDGKIILSTHPTSISQRPKLMRFSATGVQETGYDPILPNNSIITDIEQQPVSGAILVCGSAGLYRILPNGTNDLSFNTTFGGLGGGTSRRIATYQDNDNFFISGEFTSVGSNNRKGIAKINADGSLNTWQFNTTDFVHVIDVAIDSEGNILFTGINQNPISHDIYKVNPAGSLIWSRKSIGNDWMAGIKTQSDNKIIVTGMFTGIEGYAEYRKQVLRLNPDGSLDTCFDPGAGFNEWLDVATTILLDNNNDIYLSHGYFTSYNNLPVNGFVKVKGNGSGPVPNLANDSGTIANTGGTVLNVLSNDTVNGQPAASSTIALSVVSAPVGFSLTTSGTNIGQLAIAPNTPAGSYTVVYKVCSGATACDCNTAMATITVNQNTPIVANDDSFTSAANGTAVFDILGNDTYGSNPATISNVNIIFPAADANFYINGQGQLEMSPGIGGLANGTYTFTYQICDINNASNCDSATITIVKASPVVIANDDAGTVTAGIASVAVANVLANDIGTTGRRPGATLSNVNLTFVSSSNSGITLNTATGAVNVAANVPPGTYTLEYRICSKSNLSDCDNAIVTVTVTAPPMPDAVNDTITVEIGEEATINILTNDTFAGQPATVSNVTISVVGTYPANGPYFSTVTGDIFVPSTMPYGTYNFTYQICGTNSVNCDSATVTVIITSPTISPGPRANSTVVDIGLQANGNVAIIGGFSSYNNIAKNNIALLTPSLSLATFSSTGPYGPGALRDLEITDDGGMLIGGTFTGFNGTETPNGLVKLNASGTLDANFNPNGLGVQDGENISELSIRANGGIMAVGFFKKYNGQSYNNIIALTANGLPDPSFISGTGLSDPGTAIARQGSNFIIGHTGASPYQGNIVQSVFRIVDNGSLDTSFQQKVFGYNSWQYPSPGISGGIYEIKVQTDNYILVAGDFLSYDGVSRNRIVRLLPNGGLDTTFNTGTGFNGTVYTISLDANGNIYCGGAFTTYNNQPVKTIVKLSPSGALITSFNVGTGPQINSNPGTVNRLLMQGDGKILLGGHFVTYNSAYAGFITRIHPSTPGTQSRMGELWEAESANSAKSSKALIYPNPSTGIFTIDLPNAEDYGYEILVHNRLGQEVFRRTVNTHTSQLDLSALDTGNYFVRIQNNSETINKIITKK